MMTYNDTKDLIREYPQIQALVEDNKRLLTTDKACAAFCERLWRDDLNGSTDKSISGIELAEFCVLSGVNIVPYLKQMPIRVFNDTSFKNLGYEATINAPKIPNSAFNSCEDLIKVNIQSEAVIDDYVFAGCKKLRIVNAPKVASVGKYAFYECDTLHSIELPECNYVGGHAFLLCKNLERIVLPKCGFNSIDMFAFHGCKNLKEIILSRSLVNQYMDDKHLEYYDEQTQELERWIQRWFMDPKRRLPDVDVHLV